MQRHSVCRAPDSPDSLQPLSLSRKKPSFFHFLLLNVSGDPPFTFEALSADPSPTSPKPLSLVRLLLHTSLPLLLPSVFSLFSQLSTQSPCSSPYAVLSLLRRVQPVPAMPQQSQALQLQTQRLTSPLNRSSAKRQPPPPPTLEVLCPASGVVSVRQKQRGKKKKGEQRLAKRQKMMVESRGQKCGGEGSHWGKSSTAC